MYSRTRPTQNGVTVCRRTEQGKSMYSRALTQGEIRLGQQAFGQSINYRAVTLFRGSYLPFGLQNSNTAMAPDGNIYFINDYHPDFSVSSLNAKHLFIHEMMHVWQHQHGYAVRTRGMFSGFRSYYYDLDNLPLHAYPLEQQACIIADYWLLMQTTLQQWAIYKKYLGSFSFSDKKNVVAKYEKVIGGFPAGAF
ncbi:vgr related protein [Siccibacter turicensis]|uniref:vgr related protein n=1 Tax=Siccibacter turicensis TaxID=357233 RepID=UPI003F55AC06